MKQSIKTSFLACCIILLFSSNSYITKHRASGVSKNMGDLSLKLLQAQVLNNPKRNILLSGNSLYQNLAIFYTASGGETQKELSQKLLFPEDKDALFSQLQQINKVLAADSEKNNHEFKLKNAVWLNKKNVPFSPSYLKKIQTSFDAELFTSSQEKLANDIQSWIQQQSGNQLNGTVKKEEIASKSQGHQIDEIAISAVNYMKFQASWESEFDKPLSKEEKFYHSDGTNTPVPTMKQTNHILQNNSKEVQFIELDYKGKTFSMQIFQAHAGVDINEFITHADNEKLNKIVNSSYSQLTELEIPKFELSQEYYLTNSLNDLGVHTAFNKASANFDQMMIKTQQAYRIYLSDVIQESYFKMDEEGSVAHIATRSHGFGCSKQAQPMLIRINRPFYFRILHKKTQTAILSGIIHSIKN